MSVSLSLHLRLKNFSESRFISILQNLWWLSSLVNPHSHLLAISAHLTSVVAGGDLMRNAENTITIYNAYYDSVNGYDSYKRTVIPASIPGRTQVR